ncbi:MAG: porin [Geopsychrobacter sp.]|nr:porin [Geopsychrobacter sp.]
MKPAQLLRIFLPCFMVLAISLPASAAITLYDKEDTTFRTDGFFNTFYARSDSDNEISSIKSGFNQTQSRIKMGFLPNYIGFNFSKQAGDLKLGGRSSFWVTINDSDTSPVSTGIDVRQFYGTVDGDWGQVLFGKDFGLFNRTNIFLDEILTGFGKNGGIDTDGVSFGNIGSGYTYPLPSAQITYRSPTINGFKLAVGLIDPARTNAAADSEETIPRIEGELTFNRTFDKVAITAWTGFLTQTSESNISGNVESQGISYGLQAKFAGFSLTGSGFTGEGLNTSLGAFGTVLNNIDSDGYLVQGSYTYDKFRFVASYGITELDSSVKKEDETIIGAVFYSVNDYLKLVAEYSVETYSEGNLEDVTDTIALGASLSF